MAKKSKTTSKEFIDSFDYFRRTPDNGHVIIHPALPYNFIELTNEFVLELQNDLRKKIMMAHAGVEKLDATTRFAIMLLEDAY